MQTNITMLSKDITVKSYCTKCEISMRSFYTKVTTMMGVEQAYLRPGLSDCPVCGDTLMKSVLITCTLQTNLG